MKMNSFRSITVGGVTLAILLAGLSNGKAATLADWKLGEAASGPVGTSVDSSGHPSLNLSTNVVTNSGNAPTYTSFPVAGSTMHAPS